MIKDTKIGVKGMEVWKKSPLFHGMTEQEIEEHELRVFDILNAVTSAIEAKKRV